MIFLTTEEIIKLHGKLIQMTGGTDGLRDHGLLESAVYAADSGFADVERFPSVPEKAAWLAFSIIHNHAFVDGNKRIGILVMLTTLKLNGFHLAYTQKELVSLGLSIADGSYLYEDVLLWIQQH